MGAGKKTPGITTRECTKRHNCMVQCDRDGERSVESVDKTTRSSGVLCTTSPSDAARFRGASQAGSCFLRGRFALRWEPFEGKLMPLNPLFAGVERNDQL